MGENEMQRRVRKAIHESLGYDTPWETCTQCEDAARAAIEAMREPTEAMKLAVKKAEDDLGIVHAAYEHIGWEEAWPVAIDDALSQEEGK